MPTPMAMEMESNASPTAASPAPRSPGRQAPVAGTPHSQSQDRDRVGVSSSSGPATCASCRSKHLKCDGLPVCSRCYSRGINCVYLKSRRGYRGPSGGARGGKQQPGSVNGSMNDAEFGMQSPGDLGSSSSIFLPGAGVPQVASPPLNFQMVSREWDPAARPSSMAVGTNRRQWCIEAFFQYFYDSHPFLPPRNEMLRVLKAHPMDHLETAICFIGSRYVPGGSPASYLLELDAALLRSSPPKDGSTVQAMLLFALGLDGNMDQKKAVEVLMKAQTLAVELGMDQREYAVVNSLGSPIYEESLRRTWWELYAVGVMVAGLHGRDPFHLSNIMSTVPLPCDEKEYASGCIPRLHTIEEFDDSSFTNENIDWSSYTYRIAAIRNLDRVLQSTGLVFPDDPAIGRLDAYLINWNLHLPESKRSFFDQFGNFNEMLFQAHMITNVSSILLHRRLARLDGLAVQTITSCTGRPQFALGSSTEDIHTIKTTQAASNISKLVSLPVPLIRHTHFFICALTLSSIVHLSLWSALPVMGPDQDLREQIRMSAGALKALAAVWPSSHMSFEQVTRVLQKIYKNRKEAVGEVFWRDFIEEDIMTGLIEDATSNDNNA